MDTSRIYVSYRDGPDRQIAHTIYRGLVSDYGVENIYIDSVDDDVAGYDFTEYIKCQVNACDVLIAIVGPGWHESAGQLQDPNDPIRMELEAAFADNTTPVVPVMIDDVEPPKRDALPDCLVPLAQRRGIIVSEGIDVRNWDRLLAALKRAKSTELSINDTQASRARLRVHSSTRPAADFEANGFGSTMATFSKGYLSTGSFSPDGTRPTSALIGNTGEIALINPMTGEKTDKLSCDVDEMARAVTFSNRGDKIAALYPRGTMVLWNMFTGQKIFEIETGLTPFALEPMGITFGSEDQFIVCVSGDGGSRFIGLDKPEIIDSLPNDKTTTCASMANDISEKFVVGGLDGVARLFAWKGYIKPSEEIAHFDGHEGPIRAIAACGLGDTIATLCGATGAGQAIGNDATVLRTWDRQTGKENFRLELRSGGLLPLLAMTKDGQRLIAGHDQADFCLMDAQTGEVLSAGSSAFGTTRAAFSPDGKLVSMSNNEGTIYIVPLTEERSVLRHPFEEKRDAMRYNAQPE